jgi:fructan beta-fructosidase
MSKIAFKLVVLMLLAANAIGQDTSYLSQKYRPQYHFSPATGWIGDPDGLVYKNGLFHLYWWGHATSPDLVHWKEEPRPMKGDNTAFSFFSGSVAIDNQNTSGFGKESFIAVFTRHFRGDSLPETQILAVSQDTGKFYHFFEGNPVLDINKVYFRDPQVFWHTPSSMWKMVVTVPDVQQIQIFQSPDLKKWEYCSSFEGLGAKNSFWECPDLFELPVIGTNKKKWAMIIGRGPNRVQYFIGEFDGKKFTVDKEFSDYLRYGKGLDGVAFDDFETGTSKWVVKNAAFFGLSSRDVSDYIGNSFVGTATDKSSTGIMRSQTFKIEHNAINFLIAGGMHPDTTCIKLVVNGKVVRTTTGDNSKVLKWRGWDVRDLRGQDAYIEIADLDTTKKLGFVAVDHILFGDKLYDQNLEHALWLDYGPDYYATRTWRNYDTKLSFADTVFSIGWMGNWDYANKVPTSWGKGFESLPRTLALRETAYGYRLIQTPIAALNRLRNKLFSGNAIKLEKDKIWKKFHPKKNVYELEVEVKPGNSVFGINLLVGSGRKLILSYDPEIAVLTLDRSNCTDFLSDKEFTSLFAKKIQSPVNMSGDKLRLRIFVDQASIEIFNNDGESVISALTFPASGQTGVEFFTRGKDAVLSTLNLWDIDSIWSSSLKAD